ncbi:PDR/VanB family oxidoreductase [Kineosporia babensis]|uniref:PDR/VanB family oxidoreductase n=1 Tax=Kineosporia babensis TaxID=499548 RepID=A0A9X1NJ26_9ACTN|nr:PDR/VanB family oxidoreductase [Kineosporia babensis]MCD5314013.1 PDR/VanB family oxidoreductase [Kineosporia babensis]
MTDLLEVEVVARDLVADGVVQVTLSAADELPPWQPGAHLDLHLAPGLVRQYSLCGDPADRSVFRVAVLLEESGRGGSAQVHRLQPGQVLRTSRPRNHFELVPAKRYLFIAGGIGITPMLPMIGQVAGSGAQWRLVYGGRTRASMAFLSQLQEFGEQVEIRPQDETGLLDLGELFNDPDTLVYCCGPEPLLKAVEERCPPGVLHVERFNPKAPLSPEGSFEVEFAKSGVSVAVEAGVSIVEAAEEAGVQIETSCREGTCGTCESVLLEGVPEHRDSLLTPDEQAANDVIFPCVSRARSPRLVIDR